MQRGGSDIYSKNSRVSNYYDNEKATRTGRDCWVHLWHMMEHRSTVGAQAKDGLVLFYSCTRKSLYKHSGIAGCTCGTGRNISLTKVLRLRIGSFICTPSLPHKQSLDRMGALVSHDRSSV